MCAICVFLFVWFLRQSLCSTCWPIPHCVAQVGIPSTSATHTWGRNEGGCAHTMACMEVREQLIGVSCLMLPFGSPEANCGISLAASSFTCGPLVSPFVAFMAQSYVAQANPELQTLLPLTVGIADMHTHSSWPLVVYRAAMLTCCLRRCSHLALHRFYAGLRFPDCVHVDSLWRLCCQG